jgi:hypothetical protein
MTIMPQASTQSAADVAPVKAPTVTVYTDGKTQVLRIPTTHDDMMALLSRREQLSDQLNSVTQRRDGIIEQMKESPQAAQQGLQAQLDVLDARILQIESDLAQVGRELSSAPPDIISMAAEPSAPAGDSDAFAEGGAAFGVPIFLVMTAFYLIQRRRWKKGARRAPPALPSADSERLQSLEHGMDAMAIEIERISEGQRFVTKLLSESRGVEPAPR